MEREALAELIDDLVSEPDLNKRIEKGRALRRIIARAITNQQRSKNAKMDGRRQGVA